MAIDPQWYTFIPSRKQTNLKLLFSKILLAQQIILTEVVFTICAYM